MNTISRTTQRNIFCSRVFLAILLVGLIVQILLFLFIDGRWERYCDLVKRCFLRAVYGEL